MEPYSSAHAYMPEYEYPAGSSRLVTWQLWKARSLPGASWRRLFFKKFILRMHPFQLLVTD